MRRPREVIEILSDDELKLMRQAGLVVAEALTRMTGSAREGMTTNEVDAIGAEVLARHGATSNFLGYEPGYGIPPYPAVSCLSVNNEVVHGIPSDRVLKKGDLLSIDFGAIVQGYNGDAARSVIIGSADPAVVALAQATEASLWAGIGAARVGGTIGEISAAVERSVRRSGHYGIVRDFTGHGIGHHMHQPPDIPNYRCGRGATIARGMCLAIEPMVTLGRDRVATLEDEWTVVTVDSSVAAHWENTITVTSHGLWVLTEEDGGEAMLTRLGLPFGPLAD
ncbi:MAG: type I methionyl aminopeptidase [Propionibacteriaceae bacterium]|nr:type I methionyl aminopeptidase [Propionibacteriaceae bacterium]